MLLLSFLLLLRMVAPNIKIANYDSFNLQSAIYYSMKDNNTSEDANMDDLRGRSVLSNPNLLRKLSAYLELFSVPYIDRIETQIEDLL